RRRHRRPTRGRRQVRRRGPSHGLLRRRDTTTLTDAGRRRCRGDERPADARIVGYGGSHRRTPERRSAPSGSPLHQRPRRRLQGDGHPDRRRADVRRERSAGHPRNDDPQRDRGEALLSQGRRGRASHQDRPRPERSVDDRGRHRGRHSLGAARRAGEPHDLREPPPRSVDALDVARDAHVDEPGQRRSADPRGGTGAGPGARRRRCGNAQRRRGPKPRAAALRARPRDELCADRASSRGGRHLRRAGVRRRQPEARIRRAHRARSGAAPGRVVGRGAGSDDHAGRNRHRPRRRGAWRPAARRDAVRRNAAGRGDVSRRRVAGAARGGGGVRGAGVAGDAGGPVDEHARGLAASRASGAPSVSPCSRRARAGRSRGSRDYIARMEAPSHTGEHLLDATLGSPEPGQRDDTVFAVLIAISFCHLINDTLQSLLPAIYPNLKVQFGLSFVQIGLVTLAYQITASLLQPIVGLYADRRPTPLALPGGTLFTLAGLVVLSLAHSYEVLLVGACLLGVGSSVFHPESSRVARMAAGGRFGLAQSLFQVGGNAGSALGPLLAAVIVVRWGQSSLAAIALLALLSGAVLWNVGLWYKRHGLARLRNARHSTLAVASIDERHVRRGIVVLLVLVFSKYVYLASLTSYYTFYLIRRFHVSIASAQLHLFVFLAAVA